MNSIDTWLQRQATREGRLVTLEDALLSNRAWPYAAYRLRYFALRCLSSAVLHGIRLTFLQYIFSHRAFLATLVLNASAGLVTSFWWGALEVMRTRVRHLSHDTGRRGIPDEIGQWLTVAVGLAVVSLLLPAGWIAWQLGYRGRTFDVLHLYVFAIGFRLAADLMTLTFHSGVYAIRRVYRPLPAMVAVEFAGVLVVLALWPWLGRWSFPIAVLLSTTVSAGLVVHYTARLYRFLGWLPLRLVPLQLPDFTRARAVSEFFGAGLSYALLKMDAFLMLAMFHSRTATSGRISLFILFVSIGPAVQAGFDWAQLLYFDLKRLNSRCLRAFRQRYERLAFHLAWVVGLALWGLACLMGTAIIRRNLGDLYWLIGPFFLSRSLLALAQIQAFSKRQYAALLASGGVLLACMFALQTWMPTEGAKLLGLAAACAAVAAVVRAHGRHAGDEVTERRVLPAIEWLGHLQDVREPVRIRALRFRNEARPRLGPRGGTSAEEDRWRHRRMAQRVAKRLCGCGAVTILYPGQVTWYETVSAPTPVSGNALLTWGGGLVRSVTSTRFERDGVAALRTALTMNVLGSPFHTTRQPGRRPMTAPEAKQAFARMFPDGVIYSSGDRIPEQLSSIASTERRRIFFEAVHFAQHLHASAHHRRFDVTSLCTDGELSVIFIVDRRCDRALRARWRTLIRALNVEAAMARPSPIDTRGDAEERAAAPI